MICVWELFMGSKLDIEREESAMFEFFERSKKRLSAKS